jgi:hypothetical protein
MLPTARITGFGRWSSVRVSTSVELIVMTRSWLSFALAVLVAGHMSHAQAGGSAAIEVKETAGIRRTQFPVSTHVRIAKGSLSDVSGARLRLGDTEVPGQYVAESRWDDGSVQSLAVDFNASIGPLETQTYQLEYGADVDPVQMPRGLAVTEEADAIQVGNLRFSRSGSPLVMSANYRGELIGEGRNGIAIVDGSGTRGDLSSVQSLKVELLKRGPLNVIIRYSGRMFLDAAYTVPFVLTFEMPSSKSWFKLTAVVDDPSRRVRQLAVETPFAFSGYPWTWDFATENGTYGALRNATDSVLLTQTVKTRGAGAWWVDTGTQGELRPYETSAGRRANVAAGWGHFQDAKAAVAYAIEGFGENPGIYTVSLNGQGQASFGFAPAEPSLVHRFTIYQHFVGTPVAIGAATSPTSILNPLVVEVRAR